ncbi:unnamed protein product [Cuscuta europaea]|uniref:Uncharacterized protein n=1 Tax=Cuscuta europaea TaxID=41803 RepID=A0A9P1E9J4_CUSEU|nr:unnamed protein product [Cuscuta europaea]
MLLHQEREADIIEERLNIEKYQGIWLISGKPDLSSPLFSPSPRPVCSSPVPPPNMVVVYLPIIFSDVMVPTGEKFPPNVSESKNDVCTHSYTHFCTHICL